MERLFENFQYGEAGRQIYEFIWSDFADWYVEIAKEQLKNEGTKVQTAETLARVLDISLRLLHPFTPFVTEEIWGHLRSALGASSLKGFIEDWPAALIIAAWPEPRPLEGWEEARTADFSLIQEIVRSIRNLRAEKNVAPGRRISATIAAGISLGLIQEQSHVIAQLAGLNEEELSLCNSLAEKPRDAAVLVVGAVEISRAAELWPVRSRAVNRTDQPDQTAKAHHVHFHVSRSPSLSLIPVWSGLRRHSTQHARARYHCVRAAQTPSIARPT